MVKYDITIEREIKNSSDIIEFSYETEDITNYVEICRHIKKILFGCAASNINVYCDAMNNKKLIIENYVTGKTDMYNLEIKPVSSIVIDIEGIQSIKYLYDEKMKTFLYELKKYFLTDEIYECCDEEDEDDNWTKIDQNDDRIIDLSLKRIKVGPKIYNISIFID